MDYSDERKQEIMHDCDKHIESLLMWDRYLFISNNFDEVSFIMKEIKNRFLKNRFSQEQNNSDFDW